MSRFVSGDVVTDGARAGTVTHSFYWRDSDDGSMNEPKTGVLPVAWEDGTQGYHPESNLEYA